MTQHTPFTLWYYISLGERAAKKNVAAAAKNELIYVMVLFLLLRERVEFYFTLKTIRSLAITRPDFIKGHPQRPTATGSREGILMKKSILLYFLLKILIFSSKCLILCPLGPLRNSLGVQTAISLRKRARES